MTPDEAFLADICSAPDDDAPRLIYADWLEDHGEPEQAEFIRVQCELVELVAKVKARGTGQGPQAEAWRRVTLERRERELLDAAHDRVYDNRTAWSETVRHLVDSCEFRRGFVESVTLPCESFAGGSCGRCEGRGDGLTNGTMESVCTACHGTGHTPGHAGALFRAAPLTQVVLSDREPLVVAVEDGLGQTVGRWWWYWHRGDGYPATLPAVLFNLLPHYEFNTERDAQDALSAAACLLGRRRASSSDVTSCGV